MYLIFNPKATTIVLLKRVGALFSLMLFICSCQSLLTAHNQPTKRSIASAGKIVRGVRKAQDLTTRTDDLRNFERQDLQNASLRKQEMINANLQNARAVNYDFSWQDLSGVDLRGANLRGANLRGADLRKAKLIGANFLGAFYDEQTLFPKGFDKRGLIFRPLE